MSHAFLFVARGRWVLTLTLCRRFATRRVQKMTMIAEGAEAKRVEEAVEERKRKMEEKQRWEGEQTSFSAAIVLILCAGPHADRSPLGPVCSAETREERVSDWRSFQKGGKKKRQKTNVLG